MNRNDTEILYTDKYNLRLKKLRDYKHKRRIIYAEIQITNSHVIKNHMLANLIFGRFQELNSISAIYVHL